MPKKVFVNVRALHSAERGIIPEEIIWIDGTTYTIDSVLDKRPAASLKVGGGGTRYTCRISGRETNLFLEGDKWFVEGKDA